MTLEKPKQNQLQAHYHFPANEEQKYNQLHSYFDVNQDLDVSNNYWLSNYQKQKQLQDYFWQSFESYLLFY